MAKKSTKRGDVNPDPITGTPGSHPVGTGVGAAVAGAAAGVAGGMVAGPVGAVAGAALGAVAGGYAGKAVEEAIDPTAEDLYWREHFHERPYVEQGIGYEMYQPAYQYGWEARGRYPDRDFGEVESDLEREWNETASEARLGWEKARLAMRDAWDRTGSSRGAKKPR